MKKYSILLQKKNKLEEKIAKLCNQFTNSTGLIVRNALMDINVVQQIDQNLMDKTLTNYKVEINCEI